MKVFIVGITGGTGSRVAQQLIARGDQVSGLHRDPQQIGQIRAMGAVGVLGDIATISKQDLATALAGADAIVFSAGAGEQDDQSMIDKIDEGGVAKTIEAANLTGVRRVLLISVFPEAWRERHLGDEFEHYILAKKKADRSLVWSGLDWVIIRPSALQDTPGTGKVSLSPAEIHGEISRDDLAGTLAEILHTPSLQRRILEVTAGDTTIPEAVAQLQQL